MKVDRRSFLSLGVGAAAGTALSPLPWKLMDDSSIWTQMWPWTPVPPDGETVYEDATCGLCPGGCGISVRKVDNRAVKIEGQADHRINDGGICVQGNSGLQLLYGPTRVKSPMKRNDAGKLVPISWDEAIATLTEKLTEIRDNGQAHTVAAISGSDQGTVPALLKRFLTAFGSPNFMTMPSAADADRAAVEALFGQAGTTGYDVENADYILSLGAGLVDGWGSPMRMLRASGIWQENGTTVVQVEPRLSNSAVKASRWVPINPGTEADLALGIAAVMIANGLADTSAVAATGGWQKDLLANYKPQQVAETTGVDAAVIVELAKGFAGASRPLALCGRGKGLTACSLRESAATFLLNALAGNLNAEGGMVVRPETDTIQWPAVQTDDVAAQGLAQPRLDGAKAGHSLVHRLAQTVAENGAEALQLLLVAGANPCHDLPDTKAFTAALKETFVVSFSSFTDETVAMADLVLPEHIYLERYQDVPVAAGLPLPVIGLNKPVVSPQFNTRHLGQTLIETAQAMNESIADAFPWEDYESCLQETMGDRWETLMEEGVWADEDAPTLSARLRLDGVSAPAVQADGDVNSFPLLLVPFDSLRISTNYVGDTPFMIKTVADTVIKGQDGFVEINPETAAGAGLREGDAATLTTPTGQSRVLVHLFDGIKPGVIAMARGLGHTAYDGHVAGKGVNINELIGPVEDPSSGRNAAWGIRAQLAKA